MEVKFAAAKISKYASRESGDTLEMIERPHGGLSFVLVDGQRSGKSAKIISNMVARKAIQLLGEGVRDGAAARAAHDYLYSQRKGKVTATLNILSVDTNTQTIVVSRNNDAPVIIYTPENGVVLLDEPTKVVGVHRNTKPLITEMPIAEGMIVVVFTDGLRHAGTLSGNPGYDPCLATKHIIEAGIMDPRVIADTLLAEAVACDNGRPRDDISVLVTAVLPSDPEDKTRRLSVQLPLS